MSPNLDHQVSKPELLFSIYFALNYLAGLFKDDVASHFMCHIQLLCHRQISLIFSLLRSEHVKRSPNCGFLTMKKDFTELTVAEFYHMEKDRLKVYLVSVFPPTV